MYCTLYDIANQRQRMRAWISIVDITTLALLNGLVISLLICQSRIQHQPSAWLLTTSRSCSFCDSVELDRLDVGWCWSDFRKTKQEWLMLMRLACGRQHEGCKRWVQKTLETLSTKDEREYACGRWLQLADGCYSTKRIYIHHYIWLMSLRTFITWSTTVIWYSLASRTPLLAAVLALWWLVVDRAGGWLSISKEQPARLLCWPE